MGDDIVDDLTTYCLCSHVDYGWYYSANGEGCPLCRAKAEIKRLRAEVAETKVVNPDELVAEVKRLRAELEFSLAHPTFDHEVRREQ